MLPIRLRAVRPIQMCAIAYDPISGLAIRKANDNRHRESAKHGLTLREKKPEMGLPVRIFSRDHNAALFGHITTDTNAPNFANERTADLDIICPPQAIDGPVVDKSGASWGVWDGVSATQRRLRAGVSPLQRSKG